jgi:hypothetical protein
LKRNSFGDRFGVGLRKVTQQMQKFVLPIVIEKDDEGYFVFCPVLQGCYTHGDSYEEALNNIEDAILFFDKLSLAC